MKIRLYDIEWGVDLDDISEMDLPKEVIINNPTEKQIEAVDYYDDELADYLSDNYGFCIFEFKAEILENDT